MSLTESAAVTADRLRDLRSARDATTRSLEIRESQARVDTFLADASRHVTALQAILLGVARRELDDLTTRELARACHGLQVALRAMHARRSGSSQLMRVPWRDIRREVDDCLEVVLAVERSVSARLEQRLSASEITCVSRRLVEVESRAATRPHPYLPHRGVGGRLVQRAAARSDAFWDGVQGRVPGVTSGVS